MRCSTKWCTADPGPLRVRRLAGRSLSRSRFCGAPLLCATCCAAPGKRVSTKP